MSMSLYASSADYWKAQSEAWKAEAEKGLVEIERLRALLERNTETALLALTDKQRIQVFDNFCRFCGTDDLPCQCWNDE